MPGDAVAEFERLAEPIVAGTAHAGDDADGLVAHDQRKRHVELPLVEVDVGAADTGERDLDEEVAWPEFGGQGELSQLEGFAEGGHDRRVCGGWWHDGAMMVLAWWHCKRPGGEHGGVGLLHLCSEAPCRRDYAVWMGMNAIVLRSWRRPWAP